MKEELKKIFKTDETHILEAKDMAKKIFSLPSETHEVMLQVVKQTLVELHQNKINNIKNV